MKDQVEGHPNNLKWTPLNYYNCIYAFLKHVYSSEYSHLYPNFHSKYTKKKKQTDIIPSLLEVTNAYVELMNITKYEDVVIIHLMYSLWINPETMFLLTFESIDEEGNIEYFDTQVDKQLTIKLYENLHRDIMFLKEYRAKCERKIEDNVRYFKNKFIFMEDFIVSVSVSIIYNRFSRKFEGMIKWFNYTLHQILKLSKAILLIIMKKNEEEWLDLIEDTIKYLQLNLHW